MPVLIFSEDFQNTATTPVSILNYTGATGMTYTADLPWTPAFQQCDGWIANSTTTSPPPSDCVTSNTWPDIQGMANQLGLAEGMSASEASSNNVLAAFTSNGAVSINYAGYQLETAQGGVVGSYIPAAGGHFYAISVWFAEMSCVNFTHAQENLYLLINNVPTQLSSNLDPCGNPTTATSDLQVLTVQLRSASILVTATGSVNLGFQLYNAQSSGHGNDVAFDLPQIRDVTPQLDKSFSPASILTGQPSTVTFTITNTTELGEKDGWSFTDTLPAGLVVAATPNISSTCAAATVTAAAGAASITVAAGNLTAGKASCTVTVDVTSAIPGSYTNGPGNITSSVGVLPPGTATLTVAPPAVPAPSLRDALLAALGALLLGLGIVSLRRRARR